MRYVLLLLFPAFLSAQNNRLYVKTDATGTNTGSSWTNAFNNLTTALQTAVSGDTVWVAEGTYLPPDNRDSSFHPRSGVRLYGGFAGAETALDQRDWNTHPVILSGDTGIAGDSTDNNYNIMYLAYPDVNTVIDGFIFRYGMATYPGNDVTVEQPRRSGGALYIMGFDGIAYCIIRHCRFEYNHARSNGGAVYVNGSAANANGLATNSSVAPQFLNCVFQYNSAGLDGGALHRNGSSWIERNPDLSYCVFQNNWAGRNAGAFYFRETDRTDNLQVDHCIFINNHAVASGGGTKFNLGRSTGPDKLTLTNCQYGYNTSEEAAAMDILVNGFTYETSLVVMDSLEIHDNGDSLSSEIIKVELIGSPNAKWILSNLEFYNNRAMSYGIFGGLGEESSCIINKANFYGNNMITLLQLQDNARFSIDNTTFKEKKITRNLISANYPQEDLTLKNCFFQNEYPDSINFYPFYASRANINLFNCTLLDRRLFLNYGLSNSDSTFIQISNSILANTQTLLKDNTTPKRTKITFTHSALVNTAFDCSTLPPGTCGPGMLSGIDPQFVQPDSGDYHLQPCSPLVNAGNNAFVSPASTTDLDGQPRIAGGQVDMGAYERAAPVLAGSPAVTAACANGHSGSVAFVPESGCPPYTYAWSSTSGQTGLTPDSLASGTYTFTITDARGSSLTAQATIPVAGNVQISPVAAPVVCGDTLGGSAGIQVAGAMPPYTYAWETGSADSVLYGLPAGNYPVTVTDAQGCTASGAVEVAALGGLSIAIQAMSITCPGAADGGFVVTPANGQAPFTWNWENGPASPAYAPLGPGTYRGTVTDLYGCKLSWVLPLADPPAITFTTSTTPASGATQPDGSATVSNPGGGTGALAIVWSNGDTGLLADSLLPGMYTVSITDANACQQVQEVVVSYVSGVSTLHGKTLRLFPNPANDVLWLELPKQAGACRIVLTDALGRSFGQYATAQSRLALPLNDLPVGWYTVQVFGEQGAYYQGKVAIQR